MQGVFFAPLAEFFQLYLALNFLFVFGTVIAVAFADGAFEFKKVVLTHGFKVIPKSGENQILEPRGRIELPTSALPWRRSAN